MSAPRQAVRSDTPGNVPLRMYVAACAALAASVSGAVVLIASPGGSEAPAPWFLGLAWLVSGVAAVTKVGLPVRGVGGVREYTSLLEIAAVFAMVLLDPVWAMAVVVSASLGTELLLHRHAVQKAVFNTASEIIAVALGSVVFHALVPRFDGSSGAIAAALVAGALYIAVNLTTFLGLVAVLSGGVTEALRSREMRSSALVSIGFAVTGVLVAVLFVEAPAALPLMAVPVVLGHLHARGRQETLELTAARNAAVTANEAKSEFLSRLSHELRTPLNAILGFGQLLESDARLDGQGKENVGFILRSGRHLLAVIEEVLDLSQIEAGQLALTIEPVDVATVVEEALGLIRPLAAQRDIRTELASVGTDEDHVALADHHRLRQVLLNLLGNAVKYNRDGGRVTVTVQHTDDEVQVRVEDTGSGIAPEDLDRLWEPFERLVNRQAGIEGTGLGLAVSRNFVEAMNGRLEVASEVGVSSTFTVWVPRAPSPHRGDSRR